MRVDIDTEDIVKLIFQLAGETKILTKEEIKGEVEDYINYWDEWDEDTQPEITSFH